MKRGECVLGISSDIQIRFVRDSFLHWQLVGSPEMPKTAFASAEVSVINQLGCCCGVNGDALLLNQV